MNCAVVEHQTGKKTHLTNVLACSVGQRQRQPFVKLRLVDGSEQVIQGAVSCNLVDDAWYVMNASGFAI
ncbi:hypothetical protein TK5_09550 [Sideroxyarcus sp. TK5]